MSAYVFPKIGDKPVGTATSAEVLSVLTPIWNEKRETATRVKQRLKAIFNWAVAQGLRADNPVLAVGASCPRTATRSSIMRPCPFRTWARPLSRSKSSARWNEFDYGTATWTIPAHRMKTSRGHRVPLSHQAMECVLEAGEELFDGKGLVFPSRTGQPMSDMTLSKLLKDLGIPATPHGMRSSFRDWAAECSDAPREVAELALAHVEDSAAERAYGRSDLFDQRRELMQAWADYVIAA